MLASLLILILSLMHVAWAQDPQGITPVEIRIGTASKPNAPFNAYGNIFKTESSYIDKINNDGGINGRQIKLFHSDSVQTLDTRDHVFLIFGSVGTPVNTSAIHYLNQNKIPQLFVSAGSSAFYQPKKYPWTISVLPSYYMEGRAYAKYIRDYIPNPKIGILYTDNEFGKMYVQAFNDVFGTKALQTIIRQIPVSSGTPNVISQLELMERSGVNVVMYNPPLEYMVEGYRAMKRLNWLPFIFVSSSIASKDDLRKVGYQNVQGIFTATPFKDPLAFELQNDPDVQEFRAFMTQYYPDGPLDRVSVIGYVAARLLEYVLTRAADKLTREYVMAIAKNLSINGEAIGMLYPGIGIKSTPQNTQLYTGMQILKFQGDEWQASQLIHLE